MITQQGKKELQVLLSCREALETAVGFTSDEGSRAIAIIVPAIVTLFLL